MYVCVCAAVTERDVRAAVADGARTLSDLRERLGVTTGCGGCAESVSRCLQAALADAAADRGASSAHPRGIAGRRRVMPGE